MRTPDPVLAARPSEVDRVSDVDDDQPPYGFPCQGCGSLVELVEGSDFPPPSEQWCRWCEDELRRCGPATR